MQITKFTRRWNGILTLAVAAISVAVMACSSTESSDTPSTSTPPSTATAPSTQTATPGAQDAETRTVVHAMGSTEAPVEPERVVVLDMGELDMALALGVKPVGVAFYTVDQQLPTYLQDMISPDEFEVVGTVGQPDLEKITSLNPDLIISNKTRHEDIYGELSQIAPTVFAEALGADWKPQFEIVADALGLNDKHETIMASYSAEIEEFKTAMGDQLSETEVSIVRSFPDHVRIYMKASFIGTIVEDAGLPRPEPQDKDIFMERATSERIPDLDGDVIFTLYYNRSQGEQLSPLMDSPLWSRLGAVENGRVYEMDDEVWGTGLGPIAAQLVIEDLKETLAS